MDIRPVGTSLPYFFSISCWFMNNIKAKCQRLSVSLDSSIGHAILLLASRFSEDSHGNLSAFFEKAGHFQGFIYGDFLYDGLVDVFGGG